MREHTNSIIGASRGKEGKPLLLLLLRLLLLLLLWLVDISVAVVGADAAVDAEQAVAKAERTPRAQQNAATQCHPRCPPSKAQMN